MITQNRLLLPALMLSTLLHLALLSCIGPAPQQRSNDILQVRLPQFLHVPEYPSQPPSVQPAPEPLQPMKVAAVSPATAPSAVTAEAGVKPNLEPLETRKQVDQTPLLPLPDPSPPASWVDIEFEIFSGADRKSLGTGLQHYESDRKDQYQLSFKRTGQPEALDTDDDWQLEIRGRIIRDTLRPTDYRWQGGLAWQLMALTGGSTEPVPGGSRDGYMQDGIADRFSMLYQFMFSLPKEPEGQLSLSDGVNLETYNYHIVGMETMDIRPQGTLRVLHLTLSGLDHIETTELWLAPDFRYLPVKIRRTDAQGLVVEQEAISIAVK